MRREVLRVLGFFAGAALLVGLVFTWMPRLFRAAAGPDAQIVSALKQQEADGLSVEVMPGSPLLSTSQLHFDRITVELDETAPHEAQAVFTLDLTGRLGDVAVSALGLEKTRLRWTDGQWRPVDGWIPNLRRGLRALEARRRALESGDPAALSALLLPALRAHALDEPALAELRQMKDRRYQVLSWYLRAERDELLVSEEYRLQGALPARAVDEKGGRRLRLRRVGEDFLFVDGLM